MNLKLEEIKQIIISLLPDDKKDLPSSYEEDISDYYDSVMFLKLVLALEEKYQINILDDDFEPENFASISKIGELIKRYNT